MTTEDRYQRVIKLADASQQWLHESEARPINSEAYVKMAIMDLSLAIRELAEAIRQPQGTIVVGKATGGSASAKYGRKLTSSGNQPQP